MEELSETNSAEISRPETLFSLHINSVPDVLLLDIFSRLNFEELCMCSRVCQKWHVLAKDFSLRKRITVRRPLKSGQFLSLIKYHFTQFLEEFKLLKPCGQESLLSVKRNVLWKLSNKSTNLKKLVLMSCSLSVVSLEDLPSSLEHLSIRGSEIFPDVFFGLNPNMFVPHLVCLDIGGVSNFLTSQDLHVFSKLKSLRALYLEGCFRINNGGIDSIIDILPQLEVLDVEGTDISNEGALTIFNHCTNVRDLFIGHTSIDDLAFARVKTHILPHLRSFCVRNTNISSMGLHSFLLHHLSMHKLVVRANFDCSGSCKCFSIGERQVCFQIDNTFPFLAGIECQHYLSHKTYGLN
ncbi:F-box/LRR-repeat protein 12-like [Argiope bruennichi]|uniref:F-box/LRR-repeat protein 12-like n=1 Tax=Argiope bruennichi TaxID=94029 RepID=UPI0024959DE7|nr:F-box/LRR-repeat protein 12-like [Argiope bruennichi]